MLGLTASVIPRVATSYGESVSVEAWREGMARHAAFACSGSRAGALSGWFHLGCRRIRRTGADVPPPWMPTWLSAWVSWVGPLFTLSFSPPIHKRGLSEVLYGPKGRS
ncbi:hypothetical protein B296_00042980 [Ensete ventricosum]|uniref:Uncharacterized protein n=1 Tax=Ensete ventricosum TaxID=4639 RepID=A0A426XL45_ENSVE|nr:hypothetical protein B296_00042980 [Ensete ventricosum]